MLGDPPYGNHLGIPADLGRDEILRLEHGPIPPDIAGVVLGGDRQHHATGFELQQDALPVGVMFDPAFADHALPERVVQIADNELAARQPGANENQVTIQSGNPAPECGRMARIMVVEHLPQAAFAMPLEQRGFVKQE